ncbi:MAG: hypothetical protein CMK32_08360 [Porticoccaceae bacterium]|nr:hypothetical protein [Porticoccaceae bacterium]
METSAPVTGTTPTPNPIAEQAITDFFESAARRQGPWDAYRRLREQAPIYYSLERGMWFLSGYRANEALLLSPSAELQLTRRMDAIHPEWRDHPSIAKLERYIAFVDGDEHRKQRLPLNPSWTPRRMEALRPAIRAHAEQLVDDFVRAGGGSFPDRLAYPLAEHTLCSVFQFDASKLPNARELVNTMQLAFEIDVTPEQLAAADEASEVFKQFWREEYERIARDNPDNDIFAAQFKDPRFTLEDIAILAEALFSGGFDSTALTMTTGLAILLEQPGELARARRHPELLDGLPDEFLRMTATIPMTIRVAAADIDLEGHRIAVGELIGVMLGAANRDPSVFESPDRLILDRPKVRNLGLSHGAHACLGRSLAKIEMYEMFRALLAKTNHIEQVGDAVHRSRQSVRGVEKLDLKVW